MSAPKVGDRVRIVVEGPVFDVDPGGGTGGVGNIQYRWHLPLRESKGATEHGVNVSVEVLPPPEPDWWPPQPGDVARIWGSTYLRQDARWVNAADSVVPDAELLAVHAQGDEQDYGYDPPALLVRGGKPVTP